MTKFSITQVPTGRGNPGCQEIRAEGQQEVGVGQIKVRKGILLEDVFHRRPVGNVVHGVEGQMLAAHRPRKPIHQLGHVAPKGFRDHQHVVPVLLELGLEYVQGRRPVQGFKLARTPAARPAHGTGQTFGVVHRLQTRFTAGALLSLVDGIQGVALDLLGAAFHHPHDYPLGGWAGAAQGGVPVILTPDQVFGQTDRALEAELTLSNAKPFAGHRAHGGEAGPG